MLRFFIYLIIFATLSGNAVAQSVKCGVEDTKAILWTRWINEKTLPTGVEVTDRVWIRNPTSTELMIHSPNGTPLTRLVNGERYEFHTIGAQGEGWIQQDYTAALIQPKVPKLTPQQEKGLLSGKLKALPIKVPVPVYFGKKKHSIEFVFEFIKNPNFGLTAPCPNSSPSPKPH